MSAEIIERLDALIAVTKRAAMNDCYIGVDDVAAYLGFSTDHTRQRIVCRPDFPKALPIGHPRWKRSEVEEWADKLRSGDRRPGRPRKAA